MKKVTTANPENPRADSSEKRPRRASRWRFFRPDMPSSLRVYILIVGAFGGTLALYCLVAASMHASPFWLVLFFFQICASFFSVSSPVRPPEKTEGAGAHFPQSHIYAWEFFIFTGLFCFSPEVAVVIGLAHALLRCVLPLSAFRGDKFLFNVAAYAIFLYFPGKLFYAWMNQSPPLDASIVDSGWRLFAVVAASAILYWGETVLVLGFLVWKTLKIPLLPYARSRLLSLALSLAAAWAAAAVSILFRENALLVVFVAAPVVLIVLSYSRAYNQRVLALNESREFLQSSLDALSSYIAVLDEQGRIVAANQAWRRHGGGGRLFGRAIDVGANYFEFCRRHKETIDKAEAIAEGVADVIGGRQTGFTLDYCCTPGGRDAWYVVRVSRFRVAEPLRVVVEHEDITDQKLSETRLRESEERYRRFFEDDLTGDFVADGQGRLTDCNPAFARIFDFESPEKAIGTDLAAFFPDRAGAGQLIQDLRREGKLEYRELELRSAIGNALHVVANLSGRFDPSGRLLEVDGYLFDDTRRKRLELELLEAQKMEAVGQLAGGIAHDFNNLLTVVTGYGEFLQDSLRDHRRLSEEASHILDAAGEAGGLTSKLLAFSRRQVVRPTVLDLNQTVAEMSLMLRRLIGEDIELSTRLAAGRSMVRIDPSHIEQILLNLAVNSRDAMPDGGVLQLETCDVESENGDQPGDSAWVCLRVRDSGLGMTSDVRRRAFEPFFTTKEKGKGTGLGLSTVYGIVQQSGGRIEIQSEPNAGTCIEVLFPKALSGEAATPRDAAPGRTAAGSETILMVEDEEDIRVLIRNVLSTRGYRVMEAGDGAEALDLLDRYEGPVHLLLTDLVMPRMGGWELAETIRRGKRHPTMKILFISGFPGEKQGLEDAVASGRGAYLPKPFSSETLLAKVRETLDS